MSENAPLCGIENGFDENLTQEKPDRNCGEKSYIDPNDKKQKTPKNKDQTAMSTQYNLVSKIHEETPIEKAQLVTIRAKTLVSMTESCIHSRCADDIEKMLSLLSDELDRIEQEIYLAKKDMYGAGDGFDR